MRALLGLGLIISLFFSPVLSATPPVIGPVYAIKEVDLIAWIKTRLMAMKEKGELKIWQAAFQKTVSNHVKRPVPVTGVTQTTHARTFYYDPGLMIPATIRDEAGRLLAAKGTVVNPLDTVSLSEGLVFIDGDSPAQTAWLKHHRATQKAPFKVILVNGAPIELAKRWKRRVYFDQRGLLTTKLGIRQVPAVVT